MHGHVQVREGRPAVGVYRGVVQVNQGIWEHAMAKVLIDTVAEEAGDIADNRPEGVEVVNMLKDKQPDVDRQSNTGGSRHPLHARPATHSMPRSQSVN